MWIHRYVNTVFKLVGYDLLIESKSPQEMVIFCKSKNRNSFWLRGELKNSPIDKFGQSGEQKNFYITEVLIENINNSNFEKESISEDLVFINSGFGFSDLNLIVKHILTEEEIEKLSYDAITAINPKDVVSNTHEIIENNPFIINGLDVENKWIDWRWRYLFFLYEFRKYNLSTYRGELFMSIFLEDVEEFLKPPRPLGFNTLFELGLLIKKEKDRKTQNQEYELAAYFRDLEKELIQLINLSLGFIPNFPKVILLK